MPEPRHAVGPRTFALPVTAEQQRNGASELGDTTRMRHQVANLRQHAGALHVIELLGEHRHLGDERDPPSTHRFRVAATGAHAAAGRALKPSRLPPAAPVTTASASPSRSRFLRRKCAARPCARPVGAGSAHGRSRRLRMACATCTSERLATAGSITGNGCARIGSGSSSSKDVRHLRQRLLLVLNWTR